MTSQISDYNYCKPRPTCGKNLIYLDKVIVFLLLFVTALSPNLAATETTPITVRILADNLQQDSSINYFRVLLVEALDATVDDFGPYKIKQVNFEFSQDRSLQMLKRKNALDVMHTMSSSEREHEFLAVKIPLLKGLMGKRMLFIRNDRKAEFDQITIARQLKQKVACQGLHWPDSDILEANYFKVARVVIFESMFEMLEKGRCDYFPRGIHEIQPEYNNFVEKHPSLAVADNLMLSYPAPVYYFLGKHNTELARRITEGLERLIASGRFDQLMQKNPLTAHLFPLSKWRETRIFSIPNPDLPELSPTDRPELWLELGSQN